LKILHLSHGSLPDWRIEKSAISGSIHGHEIAFAGRRPIDYHTNHFSKVYEIDWPQGAKFGISFYWHYLKKQVLKVINQMRPDIVHAHNIFAAKIISELGIPFVYDDHEYTSVYVRGLAESVRLRDTNYNIKSKYSLPTSSKINNIMRRIAWNILLKNRAVNLWTKWEKEILSSSCPTIVTTNNVACELGVRYNNHKIFVVPNFPTESEVSHISDPYFYKEISSVYAGKDKFYSTGVYAHRNMIGLTDIFINNEIGVLTMIGITGESSAKIKYLGSLSRESMYREMGKHSVGLMTYRSHWSHRYKSPNKAYEYAHAGLYVMATSSFNSVIETLNGNCDVIENYYDLVEKLRSYRYSAEELYEKRCKSFHFARANLIWEKYEDNILRAYQLC
jgi:glycosyltransferase involved in cell wall biosynthesis